MSLWAPLADARATRGGAWVGSIQFAWVADRRAVSFRRCGDALGFRLTRRVS